MADFELLVGRLATFTRLSAAQRTTFIRDARVREVPADTPVITHGETASAAYFVLAGETAAGIPEPDGGYRGLSTMGAGDFFGEIAALTGSQRTADVVATRESTLLEVPAEALRAVMEVPEVSRLMLSTLAERLLRSDQPDLPRLATMDQAVLRDLRTPALPVVTPALPVVTPPPASGGG
jgi:CRP-like cAMP-binding protein